MLDPARHQPANSIQLPNRIGSSIHGYGRRDDRRTSGFWASKQGDDNDDDDSGICSPPLWKTSPTRSPQFDRNYYESLSPSSRTQAIARGQRELMEMVRNMPESTYELTLKDLVEKTTVEGEENEKEEKTSINKNEHRREDSGSSSGRKVDQRAVAARSGNIHSGGFYLKMMMFPQSLGSTKKQKKKKKKKSESSGNEGSKGTLRPSMSEGSLKGMVHKEWWKKSPSASGDSESGATSVNSGSTKSSGSSSSSDSSRRERSVGSCWFLIGRPKRLTRE